MNMERILSSVPDYKAFYTVDELDEQIRLLEKNYPDEVKVGIIGISRKGHPILNMRIGKGEKNALCFGCPHPNEPIGAMTLITLANILVKDNKLLEKLGFSWNLIPCIDPDGTRLNEGWFKGPFNISNYARNFYRPVGYEQVEWTFPFNYKGVHFDSPIPETQALMKLMDDLKPSFMFSLHNTSFGGAYWYLSDNLPELCHELENAANRQGIALQLGEPEAAYIQKYSKAVHSKLSNKAYFDYMEEYLGEVPKVAKPSGTSSFDYVDSVCKCVSLMAELPYFVDSRISDLSETSLLRRDVAFENIQISTKHYQFLGSVTDRISGLFSAENPFYKFVASCQEGVETRHAARSKQLANKEFDRMATMSEWFDNLYGMRIFECLNVALTIRACDFELDQPTCADRESLVRAKAELDQELNQMCESLESNVQYEVVPIKNLVSVQIESALVTVLHINKGM